MEFTKAGATYGSWGQLLLDSIVEMAGGGEERCSGKESARKHLSRESESPVGFCDFRERKPTATVLW